jgi:hypothetical protein
MWFDLGVSALEDLSREELIALARQQDARIAELVDRLARLEHLLSVTRPTRRCRRRVTMMPAARRPGRERVAVPLENAVRATPPASIR